MVAVRAALDARALGDRGARHHRRGARLRLDPPVGGRVRAAVPSTATVTSSRRC